MKSSNLIMLFGIWISAVIGQELEAKPWEPSDHPDPTCWNDFQFSIHDNGYYFCLLPRVVGIIGIATGGAIALVILLCIGCNCWLCCKVRSNGKYINKVYGQS